MLIATSVWGGLLGLFACTTYAAELAVVIDDVGYNASRGQRALKLPGPVTIAVLPFTPHAQALAHDAAANGKDVIIHQPMQPQPSAAVRNETHTLTMEMSNDDFDAMVAEVLDAFPTRVGVSNHTGSLLTQHRGPMQRFMRHLQRRGLFFLDSRTTAETVALQVARETGVAALRRDVFLDHDRTRQGIEQAFDKAVRLARKKGYAVLVGHPYPVTLDVLEQRLSQLPVDVQLVSVASLAAQTAEISNANLKPIAQARQPYQTAPDLDQYPSFPHISPGR